MFYNQEKKTIRTERLLLRLFQLEDAEEVARLVNNYNIYKSTMNLPYPYSIDDAIKWIKGMPKKVKSEKVFEFAITDKNTGKLFGAIALSNNKAFRNGELAYWIGEEYWGKGYATEAGKAMIEFAFKEKNYHKVYARHFRFNPASGRVLEKIGMKQEGVLVDHIIKDGRYEDLVFYGIINKNN